MTWTKQKGGTLTAPDFIIKPTHRFVTLLFKGYKAGQYPTLKAAQEAAEKIANGPN